jgi:hypothetical protein
MKDKEENLRVHGLNIYSHRENRFENPTIWAIALEVEELKSKIEEVKEIKEVDN